MFDVQLTISTAICATSLALFLAIMITSINDSCLTISDGKGCIITLIILFIISVISLFFIIKYYRLSNSPNVVHERLLDDLDKAEEELKKFYINNPQFKEVTE